MTKNEKSVGHILAIITIFFWGTTYISTKSLLVAGFLPVEILFFRFLIGFIVLSLSYPFKMRIKNKNHEIYFALAGLTGVTLFFLLENFALNYSTASNVGVIVCITPFFTAIFSHLLYKNEKLKSQFLFGFVLAMIGIFLISYKPNTTLNINPVGDILALLAAITWSIYSIFTKKINGFDYQLIQSTRRIFFYGILFMIPVLYFFNFKIDLEKFSNPKSLINIIYLGIGASVMCFLTWTSAIKRLGVTKTSVYIYAVPIITVVTAYFVLKEELTLQSFFGILFTLSGLLISENKIRLKNKSFVK